MRLFFQKSTRRGPIEQAHIWCAYGEAVVKLALTCTPDRPSAEKIIALDQQAPAPGPDADVIFSCAPKRKR